MKLKVLVPFLRIKTDERASSPLPKPNNLLNISNQKFEMAILSSIFEQSSNYIFTDIGYSPSTVMPFAHCGLKLKQGHCACWLPINISTISKERLRVLS